MVIGSMLLVSAIMGYLALHAKEVPDQSETERPHRMNPELLRMMAYVLMLLICLLAAIYELHLNYADFGR